jgi:hypothetical protein
MKRPKPATFITTMPETKKYQQQLRSPTTSSNGSTTPSRVREVLFETDMVLYTGLSTTSSTASCATNACHQTGT